MQITRFRDAAYGAKIQNYGDLRLTNTTDQSSHGNDAGSNHSDFHRGMDRSRMVLGEGVFSCAAADVEIQDVLNSPPS